MSIEKTIKDYDELRKLSLSNITSEVVFVTGSIVDKSVGIQGFFQWQAGSNEPDNRSTIIKPNLTEMNGRWYRVFDSHLSVKWFGAKGDGNNDDTQAIQNAINTAKSSSIPGVIYFPKGKYKIIKSLDIRNITNLTIIGDEFSSILNFDINDAGFYAAISNNLIIHNIQINGSLAQGIYIEKSSSIKIINCAISGAKKIGSETTSAIYLKNVQDAIIENCFFPENGLGTSSTKASLGIAVTYCMRVKIVKNICTSTAVTMGIGIENSSDILVHGNHVANPVVKLDGTAWGYGIYFYDTDGLTKHNICTENHIHNTGGTGIYLQGSTYTIVRGNIVEDTCKTIVGTSLASGGIALNNTSTNCIISDNTVKKTGNSKIANAGIRFDAENTRIIGNTIEDTTGQGILFPGKVHNSIISNNIILNTSHNAIAPYDESPATNLVISSNTINRTNKGFHGIVCSGSVNTVVCNNTVMNVGGYGVVMQSVNRFNLSNNIVTDSGAASPNEYSGIYISRSSTNGIISGNHSYNIKSQGQKYGIQILGSSAIDLVNNNFSNNQTKDISLESVTDIFLSNNRK